ncbi:MAG: hypothetical protein MZV64_02800 [Ignavibacteriales bacterium]|nr:hypothetical protein [Ignavibacteriales bacterium]
MPRGHAGLSRAVPGRVAGAVQLAGQAPRRRTGRIGAISVRSLGRDLDAHVQRGRALAGIGLPRGPGRSGR